MRTPRPAPYEHAVDSCDVQDRKALTRYRVKRLKWFGWLEGDHDNSIVRQLHGMMWSDATFRALNEARGYASQKSPTGAVAPLLAEFLDQGYVATQVLAITRLIDKGNEVVSLWRLLDDIEKSSNLITREVFVCFDGLPYDARAAETAYRAKHGRPTTSGLVGLPTSGPEAFDTAEQMHEAFDRISNRSGAARCRDDRIDPAVFDRLKQDLRGPTFESIKQLRNKFVAHAADRASRKQATSAQWAVTLRQLEEAQRTLFDVAQRIEVGLLWGSSRGILPTPQFDQLEHLDLPIVPPDRLAELHRWWNCHDRNRNAWRG